MNRFAVKGDIVYTENSSSFTEKPDSYILCEDGLCKGVASKLPDSWKNCKTFDYTGCIVMPGFVDLHAHAPQYAFCGMGLDLKLLEWLETYTFPEEAKYADMSYAAAMYRVFVNELTMSPTVCALLFGTIHTDSNLLLASLLERSCLKIMLGKVNMNRNAPDYLTETAQQSIAETERFINSIKGMKNVQAAITPRFAPSCDKELMKNLANIAQRHSLSIQSHLAESKSEIQWVKELFPDCASYTEVYRSCGLLNKKTVMAHCVHLDEYEQSIMKETGAFIAHCPQSNVNLSSGIAPAVHYMQTGQNIGLGTDVAGGASLNMFRAASDAIQSSKMRCYYTQQGRPLTVSEAFYMATKGGGAFFGKCGSFEEGYAFDLIAVNDTEALKHRSATLGQRVERILYLCDSRDVAIKFVGGKCVYEKH